MKNEANEKKDAATPETKENNPPKESKKRDYVWIFDILGTAMALIATIISVVTLSEMKIQRNNAYMPAIVFESVTIDIDQNSREQWNMFDTIKLPTRNIGVGVAKKITFSLDSSNYSPWIELCNKLNPEHPYQYETEDQVLTISQDGKTVFFGTDYQSEKTFLLPNAEEAYEFELPAQYKFFLQEMYQHTNFAMMIDIPDIAIEVSYSDVQNVIYRETIHLSVEMMKQLSGENGKLITYQFRMK